MEKAEIEAVIRRAFGCTAPLETIPADEYEKLNSAINLFDAKALKEYLPLLLIKELSDTKQHAFQVTGDQLIYFLDGYQRSAKAEGEKTGDMSSYDALLRIAERTLAEFDEGQAQAILIWLQELAYPRYRELCLRELDSAIAFWQDKVNRHRSRDGT